MTPWFLDRATRCCCPLSEDHGGKSRLADFVTVQIVTLLGYPGKGGVSPLMEAIAESRGSAAVSVTRATYPGMTYGLLTLDILRKQFPVILMRDRTDAMCFHYANENN